MAWIIGALKIVVLLGTLITIHELGHFTVARLFKVKVLKFAIGFGPKVFSKVKGETEYTLRLIPFGGFVQMEGEETRSDDVNAFNNKPVWQRMLVVLAGPFVNILFALLVYSIVVASQNVYQIAKIATLEENEPAYAYGFRSGDEILKVNGEKTVFALDVEDFIADTKNDDFTFTVKRLDQTVEIPVKLPVTKRGLLGVAFSGDRQVIYIQSNLPVASSGLKNNDVVIAINGVTVYDTDEIIETIRQMPEQDVAITVLRDMQTYTFQTKTVASEGRFLGLHYEIVSVPFLKNIAYALHDTNWYLFANLKAYGQLFLGKTKDVEVMGVVGIADEITKTSFISEFFYLMCAISLSLGIFNLLPIPALDGGRGLLLILEAIRRKPLPEKVEQYAIGISFLLIMLFAIVVTFFDVSKLFHR